MIGTFEKYIVQAGYLGSLIVVTATLITYLLKSMVFRKLKQQLDTKKHWWQYAMIAAINLPLSLLIFSVGFDALIQLHAVFLEISPAIVQKTRQVMLVIIAAWSVFRFVTISGEKYVETYPSADKGFVFAVLQIFRLVILILTAVIVLELYQIPLSGVLAFGGVGAAAVAFASKDLLGNFFGGLMIYLDQPFKVGDWVRSPEKNIEGTVEFIGWRLTRIRTFDKRPIYVPNGLFLNLIVENASRMLKRRIDTVVGLRYDDAPKLKAIIADLRKMLDEHQGIDQDEQNYVFFKQFADSSLNVSIRAHTTTTKGKEFLEIQEDILFKVLDIVSEHGAECAFPSTTVYFSNEIQTKSVS